MIRSNPVNYKKPSLLFSLLLCFGIAISASAREVAEMSVQLIELAAPLNLPEAEISGMAWCGGKLILVPQYPKRLAKQYRGKLGAKLNYFYALEKSEIVDYVDGVSEQALVATPIAVSENKLRSKIATFDGFEGIACLNDQMWLTIEAVNIFNQYQSYAVPAEFNLDSESPAIEIMASKIQGLVSQSGLKNSGEEAVLVDGSRMISFHELNGRHLVEKPQAQWVDIASEQSGKLTFPDIPFRITDVTDLDKNNRFWAMNYKYSGDKFSRKARDHLAEQYGQGVSHQQYHNVERFLEFELTSDGIQLIERPPIQLLMEGKEGRNWEGIARLVSQGRARGLLIVTDKHPATLFGFVPFDSAQNAPYRDK